MDDYSYDVFLSYSSSDKLRVRRLAERLSEAGVRVWFDEWAIKPGDDMYQAIEHGLKAARALVLCLSPASRGSGWVEIERRASKFRRALNIPRQFIPLLLTDTAIPNALREYAYIDFRNDGDEAFQELLNIFSLKGKNSIAHFMPSEILKGRGVVPTIGKDSGMEFGKSVPLWYEMWQRDAEYVNPLRSLDGLGSRPGGRSSYARDNRLAFEVFIIGTAKNLRDEYRRLRVSTLIPVERACQDIGAEFRHQILTNNNSHRLLNGLGSISCIVDDSVDCQIDNYRDNSASLNDPIHRYARWYDRRLRNIERLMRTYSAAAQHVYIYVVSNDASRLRSTVMVKGSPDSWLERLLRHLPSERCFVRRGLDSQSGLAQCMKQDLLDSLQRRLTNNEYIFERPSIDAVHNRVAAAYPEIYVPSSNYFRLLDDWLQSSSASIVVIGTSGVGKSTLLANWSMSVRVAPSIIIRHFVESDGEGSDYGAILRHVLTALRDRRLFHESIPLTLYGLEDSFRACLAEIKSPKIIVIIDGLDRLSMRSQEMRWLPSEFAANWRLIVSVATGSRASEVLLARNWSRIDIKSRTAGVGKTYMKRFAENGLIIPNAETSKGNLIDAVLAMRSSELVDHVLEQSISDNAWDLLCLLWGARRGLSESEICGIKNIAIADCLELQYEIGILIRKSGDFISLNRSDIRSAVERRLPRRQLAAAAIHRRLAEYFSQGAIDARCAEEAPWQWLQSGDIGELRRSVQNVAMLSAMLSTGREHELLGYWRAIGDSKDLASAYLESIDLWLADIQNADEHIPKYVMLLERLGELLNAYGLHSGAAQILEQVVSLRSRYLPFESADMVCVKTALGDTFRRLGRFSEAMEVLNQSYGMLRYLPDLDVKTRARVVSDVGITLYESGKPGDEEPLDYLREALRMKKDALGSGHPSVAETLNDMAFIHLERGARRTALSLYQEALECQRLNTGSDDHPTIATYLDNLASAYRSIGRKATALTLYYQALGIRERILRNEHPHTLLTRMNMASLYYERGEVDESRAICHAVCRDVVESPDRDTASYLAVSISAARLLGSLGEPEQACELLLETAGLCMRSFGLEHRTTATCLHNLAGLYRRIGQYDNARRYYEEAIEGWRNILGVDHPQVANTLRLLADVLVESNSALTIAEGHA